MYCEIFWFPFKNCFLTLLPSLLLAQDLVQARPVKSCESFFDDIPTGESNFPGYVALDGRYSVRDMMGNVTSASKVKVEVFQIGTAILKVHRKEGSQGINDLKFELLDPGNPLPQNRVIVSLGGKEVNGKIQSLRIIGNDGIESPLWGIKLLLDILFDRGIDLKFVKFNFSEMNRFLGNLEFTADLIRNSITEPDSELVDVVRELFKETIDLEKKITLASIIYTKAKTEFDSEQTIKEILLEAFSKYVHPNADFDPHTIEDYNRILLKGVMYRAIMEEDTTWITSGLSKLSGDTFFLLNEIIHDYYFDRWGSLGFGSTPAELKVSFSRIMNEIKDKVFDEIESFKTIPGYKINPYYFRTILALRGWFFTSRHQTSLVELLDPFEGVREIFLEYTKLLSNQINRNKIQVDITTWWVDILMMRAYLGDDSESLRVSLTYALRDSDRGYVRDRIRKILENNF